MRFDRARVNFATTLLALIGVAGCGDSSHKTDPGTSGYAEDTDQTVTSSTLDNGDFTADVEGRRVHYVVSGSGPALMVLPNSWGITIEGLQGLFGGLEDEFTLVYFDPRGMGGSGEIEEEADMGMAAVRTDFDRIRSHLGLDQVRVIGWSNGAQNLVYLAAEYPDTITHAVFLHGVPRFGPEDMAPIVERYPDLTAAFGAIQQELANESMSDAEKDSKWKSFVIETWFPELFADPEAGRRALRGIFADTEMSWNHNVYSNVELGGGFDSRGRLGSIAAKSLVIAGARDMVPPSRAEEIHSGIADSKFVVFENSGHFAPLEEPDLFDSIVVEFLEPGSSP